MARKLKVNENFDLKKWRSQKVKEIHKEKGEDFYNFAYDAIKKHSLSEKIPRKKPKNFSSKQKQTISKIYGETLGHRLESFIPVKKEKLESNKKFSTRLSKIKSIYGQNGSLANGVWISIPAHVAKKSHFDGINFYSGEIETASGITIEKHIPTDKMEIFILANDGMIDALSDYIMDVWENNGKPDYLHCLYHTGKTAHGLEFKEKSAFDSAHDMAQFIISNTLKYEGMKKHEFLNGFIAVYVKEDRRPDEIEKSYPIEPRKSAKKKPATKKPTIKTPQKKKEIVKPSVKRFKRRIKR